MPRFCNLATGPVHAPDAQPRAVLARGELAADEQSTIELFRKASPSVVNITTSTVVQGIFSLNPQEIPRGTGSGFIWDEDGHVVTNYHVIHGADSAKIKLADHSEYDARLTGAEPSYDLAVLKIDAPKSKLHAIPIGSSADLQVGQKVFAIGNPFGLDQTLTTGVVSALGREIKSPTEQIISGVIQTDAAINPGNSGGPLLDSAGRLIGVNTAIFSPSGAYAGIGFAIPVDTVNEIVPQLIRRGRAARPDTGITFVEDRQAQSLGVRNGVLIAKVRGPAAEAGLKSTRRVPGGIVLGDIIIAIDGKPVRNRLELERALAKAKVGDTITLTIVRDQDRLEVPLTLREA